MYTQKVNRESIYHNLFNIVVHAVTINIPPNFMHFASCSTDSVPKTIIM